MQAESLIDKSESQDLKQVWAAFRKENPSVRIRDAAVALNVTELELLATGCGDTAVRLMPQWAEIINALQKLGIVMALTRNHAAVHEKTGVYNNVRIMGNMGLVLDEAIDLRLFLSHWHHGFAVSEQTQSGARRSLQFFDADGTAVHKIYLTEASVLSEYDALVELYRGEDQSPQVEIIPSPRKPAARPDDEIDIENFRAGWRALKDTHDFFDLTKSYGVTRTQALRLGGPEFARQTSPEVFGEFMQSLSSDSMNIMVFVGSPGVIQIHSGPVCQLRTMGSWFNVLDDEFNLHLREDLIDSAWVVRKPTVDGDVTSLELFDAEGEVIAYLFGVRKPGQAEDLAWRKKVNALPSLEGGRE